MGARPRLLLPRSRFEGLLEGLALLGLATQIWLVVRYWPGLTAPIPRHFGLNGEPDAFGGKVWLILTLAIALALYVALGLVQRIPHRYNYVWPITEDNAARQYRLARTLITGLKTILVYVLGLVTWQQVRAGLGEPASLGPAFIPLMFAALVGAVGLYVMRASRLR